MQYLRTRLATDFEPSTLARFLRAIRFPVANPDYDHKLHLVREWLIEFDDDGNPFREIGLDTNGRLLFAGPDERNYGFWLDTNMTFGDFKGEPITQAEFERRWSDNKHPFDGGATTVDAALDAVLVEWHGSKLQEQLRADVTAAYSEPHRRYHTLQHIEFCLRELGKHWLHAVRLSEIRWALLFHDAIYDPRRNDNEARSADWACRVMQELQRPEDEIARVRRLILATVHAAQAETSDEALLLDIDLSILGADEATFDEYDRAIRVEYEWVPEEAYRLARAAVLHGFLQRQRIFQTAAYRDLEPIARRNIGRALERLP